MDPLSGVVLLAVLFVGSHIGLATTPVRSRLVARLGEWGFRGLFFAVAAVSFTAVTVYYAEHRGEGAPGLALGSLPALRWVLVSMVVAGVTLMVASFASYPGSPYDLDRPGRSRPPRGLERVTRHPFFAGVVLFAGAHALLAPHRTGTVLMLALAVLAVVGPLHQDAKLTRLRGRAFADYVAVTSAVPFAAIVAGRQTLVWRELPFGAILAGLAVAAGLRYAHDEIFAHHGLWVILVTVGGALGIAVVAWRRDRRLAGVGREPAPVPGSFDGALKKPR